MTFSASSSLLVLCWASSLLLAAVTAFQSPSVPSILATHHHAAAAALTTTRGSPLFQSSSVPPPKRKGYVPKWKKKKTLVDLDGPKDFDQVGLKGNIRVVFRQGNETKSTMALAGQPLRDVASQAGQFIKYGCGKGECGTCESLVNGQWIRPCSVTVPPMAQGKEYVVQVKESKATVVSSGKFYSVRSIFLGFWNNLLGMAGLVRDRRLAKKNWAERQDYEQMILQKTLEKKRARLEGGGDEGTNLKP
jgi:hypothetical protein